MNERRRLLCCLFILHYKLKNPKRLVVTAEMVKAVDATQIATGQAKTR